MLKEIHMIKVPTFNLSVIAYEISGEDGTKFVSIVDNEPIAFDSIANVKAFMQGYFEEEARWNK